MFGSTSSNEKQLEDAICAVKSASKLFNMGSLTQTAIPLKSLMKLNMEFGPVNIWKPAWTDVLAALFSSLLITFHSYIQKQGYCFRTTRVIVTDIFSTDSGRFTLFLCKHASYYELVYVMDSSILKAFPFWTLCEISL